MRHGDNKRKFGREKNQRKALMRSLAEGLVIRGKIRTTEARAKELRPYVEKLITAGKRGTLAARRNIISELGTEMRAKKLIGIAAKYVDRTGGYTRITKLAPRKSDGSKMAVIELI